MKDELCSASWFTKERQHSRPLNGYYGETKLFPWRFETEPAHIDAVWNTMIRRAP